MQKLGMKPHHFTDFVLIDLSSQHEAFHGFTKGWLFEEILGWMRFYGKVDGPFEHSSIGVYTFEATCGYRVVFYPAEDGLVIIHPW
jgi:hypothetical protein